MVRTIEVERYYNPTLPGNFGWHAYDDDGHHGFGRTDKEAIEDYARQISQEA